MPDLTRGRVLPALLAFAVPLTVANLLQQGYLLVDGAVVGHYAGVTGLAAIGVAYPAYTMLSALFTGLASAFSVRLGQLTGAGRPDDPSAVVALAACTVVWSVVCAGAAALLAGPLLAVTGVTGPVAAQARTFLLVLGGGLGALFAMGAVGAVLTGRGDARRATALLIATSVLNALFAWLFVGPAGLGVAGAALAVVTANGLTALAGAVHLVRGHRRTGRRPDAAAVRAEVRGGLRLGAPLAVQYLLIGVGVLILVAIVTPYGSAALAALTVVARLELLTSMAFLQLSAAVLVFTAQNLGAGRPARVRIGRSRAVALTLGTSAALSVLLVTGRGAVAAVFSADPAVRAVTERYLLITAPFFVCYTLTVVLHGWFTGTGRTAVPLVCTVVALLIVRLPLSYVLGTRWGVDGVMWATVAGWVTGLAWTLGAARRARTAPRPAELVPG